MTLKDNVLSVLRGIGQIMLQENALTGLGFLIGIFIGSPMMAFAALVASITGMLTGKVLNYDENEIKSGLYGFSPALVGVAMILFFQSNILVWAGILIGSFLSAVLQHFFIQKKIPAFTFPFVLITWLLIYFFRNILNIEAPVTSETSEIFATDLGFLFTGYGQVIFQGSILAGIIFFVSVCADSWLAGLFGLLGSFLGAGIAYLLKVDLDSISMGLLGYNAVLTAIVFSGKKPVNFLWTLVSALFSVLICLIFSKIHFIALTFPFVAATWLVLISKKFGKFNF